MSDNSSDSEEIVSEEIIQAMEQQADVVDIVDQPLEDEDAKLPEGTVLSSEIPEDTSRARFDVHGDHVYTI